MNKVKLTYVLFSMMLLSIGSAMASNAAPATYIMQVSSNLGCDTLHVQLVSKTQDAPYEIVFGSGAFAGVQLPAGEYEFGDVNCKSSTSKESFDLLSKRMSPITLNPGQTYYAGRLIFKELKDDELSDEPKELSSCTRTVSRARGDSDNSCRDGVGVARRDKKQVNIYLPQESDEDVSKVQIALNISQEQFKYMPLKG